MRVTTHPSSSSSSFAFNHQHSPSLPPPSPALLPPRHLPCCPSLRHRPSHCYLHSPLCLLGIPLQVMFSPQLSSLPPLPAYISNFSSCPAIASQGRHDYLACFAIAVISDDRNRCIHLPRHIHCNPPHHPAVKWLSVSVASPFEACSSLTNAAAGSAVVIGRGARICSIACHLTHCHCAFRQRVKVTFQPFFVDRQLYFRCQSFKRRSSR